jgi:ABC-2 type transport system permease protein
MWMLFFGFLFHHYTLETMPENIQYLDFLAPGICTMTVLFGASQSGIELIRDMQTLFLDRVIAAPAAKSMLLGGKIAADVSRLLIQAMLVLFLAIALGARLQINLHSLTQTIASLTLFGIAFSSLSCWIALKARSQENMATFVHLVNMPMLFTSSTLVPDKQMPHWLASIAQLNPLSLTVNPIRDTLILGQNTPLLQKLLPLFLIAGFFFILAVSTFRNYYSDT